MIPKSYEVLFDGVRFDLIGQGLQRMLSQFFDKCVLRQFFAVFLQEAQELYDACIDMQEARTLYAAEGEILDALGRIVGQDRGLWQYDDFSWFFFDRQGQGFDQVPMWCLYAPTSIRQESDDNIYKQNIIGKIHKNHTLTGSLPEVQARVSEVMDAGISFEKVGPNRVKIIAPSTLSTTQLQLLLLSYTDRRVDDGYYLPYPVTLDFDGLMIYVPGDFLIYDRNDRLFDVSPLAVGVPTEWGFI